MGQRRTKRVSPPASAAALPDRGDHEPAGERPPLPPPHPRRPSWLLLATSVLLFGGWLIYLLLLAVRKE